MQTHFTIGDSDRDRRRQHQDDRAGEWRVVRKSMPTSMGKGQRRPNGAYRRLRGTAHHHGLVTYGVPVNSPTDNRCHDWATQISYSGVFDRSAPWSVGLRPHQHQPWLPNSGHDSAQWFCDHVKRGGHRRGGQAPWVAPAPRIDGLGDWNIPAGTSGAPVTPGVSAPFPDNQQRPMRFCSDRMVRCARR